jgi:hypothetical protein
MLTALTLHSALPAILWGEIPKLGLNETITGAAKRKEAFSWEYIAKVWSRQDQMLHIPTPSIRASSQ